ncbi:hypothetical protein [Vibrio algarum]|uniref:Pua-like domain-containing protein n=1 Tax=Vibrio algarum TaxID=3020714 RepID=A0ABT4YT21_9VIBR|nr:hypothetical protein [Vibrio sp. KJ40-1]MDB1124699.1 hypothetical protein [Vibrio sp. KJ40-1]
MAAPRIILRFRNARTDVDTISEHQKLINLHDNVYWGWWKKDTEISQSHLFGEQPGSAYIIDTSEEKLYLAEYSKSFLSEKEKPTINLVPEYYRENCDKVAGWFVLNRIQEVPYSKEFETIIGQKTFEQLRVNVKDSIHDESDKQLQITTKKSSILHISDIHFGKDHAFDLSNKKSGIWKKVYLMY